MVLSSVIFHCPAKVKEKTEIGIKGLERTKFYSSGGFSASFLLGRKVLNAHCLRFSFTCIFLGVYLVFSKVIML